MGHTSESERFDVLAFGAHPDDLEVVLGGTAAKLVRSGLTVLFVDLCDGEPARHAIRGVRQRQADQAATILGVRRATLLLRDRFIRDSPEARLAVARLIRQHKPRLVFTTAGAGVHPDHAAVTDIVVNGVFYARLPKWDEAIGGEALDGTEPHEIERLFFGHCRMEPPWTGFDFAVDVSDVYAEKMAAVTVYESVFSGDQATLVDKYSAEDRYGQPGWCPVCRGVQGPQSVARRESHGVL
jgi:N-acetylglucosamine malate deacetylase 1